MNIKQLMSTNMLNISKKSTKIFFSTKRIDW